METKELVLYLRANSSQVEYGYGFDDWKLLDDAANIIDRQTDCIAELEKEKIKAYDNGFEDGQKSLTTNAEPVAWRLFNTTSDDYLKLTDSYSEMREWEDNLGDNEKVIPLYTTPQTKKKDREADRKRFSDEAFNCWLDESISDSGHTVYDQVNDVCEAWYGWFNSQFYTTPQTCNGFCGVEECKENQANCKRLASQTKPLSDEEMNKAFDYYCETDEGVLRFDYELRKEWKEKELQRWKEAFARAIEERHGIK